MDAHNLADLYDLPTLDWESVRHVMDSGVTQAPDSGGPNRHSSWLTTVDPDGTPHTTAVGALWVDETYWFQTGAGTRKARNLAQIELVPVPRPHGDLLGGREDQVEAVEPITRHRTNDLGHTA